MFNLSTPWEQEPSLEEIEQKCFRCEKLMPLKNEYENYEGLSNSYADDGDIIQAYIGGWSG